MTKFWTNDGKLVLTGGNLILCDECPCTGTATATASLGDPCTICCDDDGAAPSIFTVDIAGAIDDTCTNCENYDGSYLLTNLVPCFWSYVGTPDHCMPDWGYGTSTQVRITISKPADICYMTGVLRQVIKGPVGEGDQKVNTYSWSNQASSFDCMNLSEYSLIYQGQVLEYPSKSCIFSSATFKVSSGG